MARAFLPMFVCLFAAAATAQGTPEAALVELALAKDFKSAARHYPVAVVEALKDLPASDQAVARNELLPIKELYGMPVVAKASDVDSDLLRLDTADAKRKLSLRVKRQVSDGVTAMLELESCEDNRCWGAWRAWMKVEEGEWRLDEITEGWNRMSMTLADPDLIAKLQHAEMHHNEEAAIQSIREIAGAAVNYATTFKNIGFPEQLVLMTEVAKKPEVASTAETDGEEPPPDPEHAGLLDDSYGKKLCEKEGYRFEYTLLRHGSESTGAFAITATPIDFGKSGSRSFYLDESGILRATKEDQMSTVTDTPVR